MTEMDVAAWVSWSAKVEQRLAAVEKWQKARADDLRFKGTEAEFEDFLAATVVAVADDRIEKRAFLRDEGTWTAERKYLPGSLVTSGGAAWVAKVATTGVRPGDSAAWRLAAKSDLAELKRAVREEVRHQMRNGKAA